MPYPQRKSPRMKGYNYSSPASYFITICTHQKRCIFGQPSQLNSWGCIAAQNIEAISVYSPGVVVEKYVVMPNHVHMLISKVDESSLPSIIGTYKASVTKAIRRTHPEAEVWQRSYHDHIIHTETVWEQIWHYIAANPVQWETDCFYQPA